ncbi:MAG TPA: DNA alkylation repair protein [Membranihabitans sp.]|nr:DNA alkylation repair protein [Membranihabitans sp.]
MKSDFEIHDVHRVFSEYTNAEIASGQKAYMKGKFDFYGIQSVRRRELQRPFLMKNWLPEKSVAWGIIRDAWEAPQREMQYFAMDLMARYHSKLEKQDLEFLEELITKKSWWDTVDFLASHSVGIYMTKFPKVRDIYVERWLESGNIWLQRTCLIFQLKYQEDLDNQLLEEIIDRLEGSKEFFINKAIGWILREYSKTNPEWVVNFVERIPLHALSKREALRRIGGG